MADALNDVHLWSVLLGSRVVNHLKMCRLKFSIISIKPGTTCTSVVLDLKREMESSAGSFELKALSMEQCFEWLFFFNFMHFEGVFCDLRVAENGTKCLSTIICTV